MKKAGKHHHKHDQNLDKKKEKESEAKVKEYDVLWDKYLRTNAEFENARKRWEREKEDVLKFANYSLLKEVIIILDEMEQALKMVKEHSNIDEISKGLEIMYNNFLKVLHKRGFKYIEAKGKKFDPHLHEIVTTKDVDSDDQDHMVLEEIQKGYLLEDKVLRTAKVIVGIKRTPDLSDEEEKEPQQEDSNDF